MTSILLVQRAEQADSLGMAGGLQSECPRAKNEWLTFLTFDLLIKIVILHALLAVSMTSILLVIRGGRGRLGSEAIKIQHTCFGSDEHIRNILQISIINSEKAKELKDYRILHTPCNRFSNNLHIWNLILVV